MAVNFVAVGDGFCVTDERSVDPPDTQHQQLPKDCLLLGCGELRADILLNLREKLGELQKNCKRLEQTQFLSVLTSMDCKNATKSKV